MRDYIVNEYLKLNPSPHFYLSALWEALTPRSYSSKHKTFVYHLYNIGPTLLDLR